MANISTSTVAYATRQTTGQLVFIASDGTTCVLWTDGTNQVISYDDNTYASWTKATLTTGLNMMLAGHFRAGTDNIDEVTGGASNVRGNYRLLTKSGAAWTVGSANALSGTIAIGVTAQGSPTNYIGQDAQGRHWVVVSGATNTLETCYYSAANSPTTTGWTASGAVTQTADLFTPAADQVGNYLIKIYWNGTALQWHRVDNSGASVGSWTTGATIANLTGAPNASSAVNFKAISATTGLLTYSSGSGVYAQLYDVSSNTFGTATQLSTNANDRHPTIAVDGAGNAWVVWCKYAAANSFSLVYKKYSGSWGTETELVASGTNISYPNAGYGYKTLGVAYTQGTASPYTVGWASQMMGGAEAITGVSAALSGPMALTLYGSATPDAVLPNACDVAVNTAGGVETSKVSTFSTGSGNFAEVRSKGGTFAAVSAIPTNPTGYGWGYQPGAGTFNGATPWDAIITCSATDNSGSWRLRFFKYDGASTYTPITTLTTAITATAKTIYNFPASTVAAVDFLATDWLVWDLYYETTYGAVSNTVTCYEATTSAAGVANEMQITTPVFSPAVTGTTYSNDITGVSASLLQTTEIISSSVSLASKQSGISKNLVGISAALGVSVTTYPKTITGVSSAFIQTNIAKNLTPISLALLQTNTKNLTSVSSAFIQTNIKIISGVSGCFKSTVNCNITSLSSALKSLNNAKNISSVSAAIGQSAIPVTITSVSAAFKALGVSLNLTGVTVAVGQGAIPKTITGVTVAIKAVGVTKTITGVSGAVLQPNIAKTISGVSTALSLLYARNMTGVSAAFIQTNTKTSVSISAVIAVTTTKNISNVSVAVLATVAKNSVSISSVLKALGVSQTITSVSAAIGQAAIPRNITGISVSVKSLNNPKVLTPVSVALLQSNITKNISGVFSALVFTGTKSVSSVSGSFLSLGNSKVLTSISSAFIQTGIQKTITSVSASVQASANAKTISGISAVVSLTNAKTLTNASAALQAVNISKSLVGVSVYLVREKNIVSVSGAFKATNTLTLTSIKSAIGQSGIESQISSVSAAFIQTNTKTLTPVSLAVQQVGITRNVTGVKVTLVQTYLKTITNSSAALKALGVAQRLTSVSVVVQKRNIARQIENVSANFTYSGEYLYVIVKASRDEITVSGLTDKVVAQATRGELAVKRATIKI